MDGIPYTVEARPDTGLNNPKIGIWMFLASEVMLFGALFSSYILLRIGATEWPSGVLNVPIAFVNTVILIASSVTVVLAWSAIKLGEVKKHRIYLLLTFLCGAAFLVNKYIEYTTKFHHGIFPSTNNFFGLYFTMTGLHGFHVIGGMIVFLYHLGPGWKIHKRNPEMYVNRVEVTGLYWHFVDLVWIFLFPVFYLL